MEQKCFYKSGISCSFHWKVGFSIEVYSSSSSEYSATLKLNDNMHENVGTLPVHATVLKI